MQEWVESGTGGPIFSSRQRRGRQGSLDSSDELALGCEILILTSQPATMAGTTAAVRDARSRVPDAKSDMPNATCCHILRVPCLYI